MSKTQGFNIDLYDEVSACEQGYEFEATTPNGGGTGFFIVVRGNESESIQKQLADQVNKARQKAWMAEKTGKPTPPSDFERDMKEGMELTVSRIISWRGIVDKDGKEVPFSKDEGMRVLKRFPSLAKQIVEASIELSNFIKP